MKKEVKKAVSKKEVGSMIKMSERKDKKEDAKMMKVAAKKDMKKDMKNDKKMLGKKKDCK